MTIVKDDTKYVEYLPLDGEYHAFPLTMGDGEYTVTIYLFKQDNLYNRMLDASFSVTVGDPLYCFTLPIPLANFDEESTVVQVAKQLYSSSSSDLEFVKNSFEWSVSSVEYDTDIIESLASLGNNIYVPNLERVIEEGSAICTDFASLFSAILRSCGIPCQIVYGDVESLEGVLSHAWNLV